MYTAYCWQTLIRNKLRSRGAQKYCLMGVVIRKWVRLEQQHLPPQVTVVQIQLWALQLQRRSVVAPLWLAKVFLIMKFVTKKTWIKRELPERIWIILTLCWNPLLSYTVVTRIFRSFDQGSLHQCGSGRYHKVVERSNITLYEQS